MNTTYILDVLKLFADNDDCDSLHWRCDGEYSPIQFFVNCNDLFYWACADAEEITGDNLPILKQAYADVTAINNCKSYWAPQLFACRVRKMRPQVAIEVPGELRELFKVCGPERAAKECW